MKTKDALMDGVFNTGAEGTLETVALDVPDAARVAVVETLIDIRDQLVLLNKKIPVVRQPGTPGSAPPPEVR
jgi:hypothetical protein